MQPIQGIRYIHVAICREAHAIEEAAAIAETPDQLAALAARFAFFADVNEHHIAGEESGLYPELDKRIRHVGAAYLHDHRDERALFADLTAKLAAAREQPTAGALAKVRRQTIALTEHVLPHVKKEDELVTPLVVELFSPSEQSSIIGRIMAAFPPDKLAKAVPWLVTLIDPPDRIAYVSMMKAVMPPDRFPIACGWIKNGCAADVWSQIAAAVPGVA